MGHWYNSLGEPCYDVGLRVARKQGYLPSVTSIDKIIANPGLEIWKQNQVLEASLTLTRGDNESDYDFIARIKADSKAQGRKAAKLGTVIHHLAERHCMDKPLFFHGERADVWQIFKPLEDWIDDNLIMPDKGFINPEGAEVVLVNERLGYAGKADYIGKDFDNKKVILDFKTTTIKPTDIKKDGTLRKGKLYPSWARQLVALQTALGRIDNRLLSVVVSTNLDCLGVWVHEWCESDLRKAWVEFEGALQIYKSVNNI